MELIRIRANAKINLTLDILGRLDNGYHRVEMVMQSVDLCDTVVVAATAAAAAANENAGNIRLRCSRARIPCDSRNLAYKAAEAFFAYTGLDNPGILIDITKRIPVAAGLAGGSADAAAVIAGLNDLFGTRLDGQALKAIAAPLGADIPFCLTGGTMLAQGVGDELTPAPPMPECLIVLAKPRRSIKTAAAYADYDRFGGGVHPDTRGMLDALRQKEIGRVAGLLCNVLEEVARLDEIRLIEQAMTACGALGTHMSGSGPSVFGIFLPQQQADAQKCLRALRTECGFKEVFMTKPAPQGLQKV